MPDDYLSNLSKSVLGDIQSDVKQEKSAATDAVAAAKGAGAKIESDVTKAKEPGGALNPPTPQPMPKEEAQDPWKAWGSPAMMIGVLGGLLTRNHLTTSLNAAAAINKSVQAQDMNAAKQKFEEWKVANQNMKDQAEFNLKTFKEIIDSDKMDMDTKLATLKTLAAARQVDESFFKDLDTAHRWTLDTQVKLQEMNERGQRIQKQGDEYANLHNLQEAIKARQANKDPAKVAELDQSVKNASEIVNAGKQDKLSLTGTPGSMWMKKKMSENPDAGADQIAEWAKQAKDIDKAAPKTGLSEDALEMDAYSRLFFGKYPPGMGGKEDKEAVDNRAAELAKKIGISYLDVAFLPADKKMQAQALAKDIIWYDGTRRSQNIVEGQLPIVQEYLDKMPLTEIRTINKGIMEGATEFGSAEANNYAQAMTTLAFEWGRLEAGPQSIAMLPIEVINVGMKRFVNVTPHQFRGERELLPKEAQNFVTSQKRVMDDRRKEFRDIGSGTSATPTATLNGGKIEVRDGKSEIHQDGGWSVERVQ